MKNIKIQNYRINITHKSTFMVWGNGDTIPEAYADACSNLSKEGIAAVDIMEVVVLATICAGSPVLFKGSGSAFKKSYNII